MANKTYTIPIKLDGNNYRLVFSLNAMATIQEETGINPFGENFMDELQEQLNPVVLRAVLWAVMLDEHPELTKTDVGKMIRVDNMGYITEQLTNAWSVSNEEEGGAQEKKVEAPPQEEEN